MKLKWRCWLHAFIFRLLFNFSAFAFHLFWSFLSSAWLCNIIPIRAEECCDAVSLHIHTHTHTALWKQKTQVPTHAHKVSHCNYKLGERNIRVVWKTTREEWWQRDVTPLCLSSSTSSCNSRPHPHPLFAAIKVVPRYKWNTAPPFSYPPRTHI